MHSFIVYVPSLPVFKPKHRRKRKSNGQIKILKDAFHSNPGWTKDQVQDLSKTTGLSEAQVYKWGWDYRKKMKTEPVCNADLESPETLGPSLFDARLWTIQQTFRQHIRWIARD